MSSGQIAYHLESSPSASSSGPIIRNIAHGLANTYTWSFWLDMSVRFQHNVHDIPIAYGEAMLAPLMKDVLVDTTGTREELSRIDEGGCG